MGRIRLGIGLQARISSRRLHNKIFHELWDKETVLDNCLKRIEEMIFALPQYDMECHLLVPDEQKQVFEHISKKWNVPITTGPENDVITRFRNLQGKRNFEYIIRLTGDCPVFHPLVAAKVITEVIEKKYDYGCTLTPTDWFDGSDIEIFTADILKKLLYYAWEKKDAQTREHVTWPIKNDPQFFCLKYFEPKDPLFKNFGKLSIDTLEDLERVQAMRKDLWWIT